MSQDGDWERIFDYATHDVTRGYRLILSPVFYAEIVPLPDGWWQPVLNSKRMAKCRDLAVAKAYVDADIWNQLRQIREAYKRLLTRREAWEDIQNRFIPKKGPA